ncbi:hypothetical protein Gotur_011375 [Gossypium turneri]
MKVRQKAIYRLQATGSSVCKCRWSLRLIIVAASKTNGNEIGSNEVGAKDSIIVEVGAIIIALDVYLAMEWKGKSSLIIEIGSNEDIENKMVRIGNVSFSKAEKHGNEMAYALALAGIKRLGMFKTWW